ncbi:MAG: alpha/beta fold hydrolase [Candidatus Woykebacteria bacterium]
MQVGPSWRPRLLTGLIAALNPVAYWGRFVPLTNVPRGNGAALLLVPGFMGAQITPMYFSLERTLSSVEYTPRASGVGITAGCPNYLTQLVCGAIDTAAQRTGMQVHLIGHSLGSAIVRSAAKRRPTKVASVISIAGTVRGARVNPLVYTAARLIIPQDCQGDCHCRFHKSLSKSVPSSVARLALYSRQDEVIVWEDCIEEAGGENIEVLWANHFNIVTHAKTCQEIIGFLAAHPAKKLAIA